ncbi:hypothetical protein PybrP1_004988 [[Pythium] brassicae (nom. inval.)]|nr:hypothetical protein PybrP1_004988 [[Pythium] brassicae (nom. inval.)]
MALNRLAQRTTLALLAVATAASTTSTTLTADAQLTAVNLCADADFLVLAATHLGSGPVPIKSLGCGDQVCIELALSTAASGVS